jgi:hypothetical protein
MVVPVAEYYPWCKETVVGWIDQRLLLASPASQTFRDCEASMTWSHWLIGHRRQDRFLVANDNLFQIWNSAECSPVATVAAITGLIGVGFSRSGGRAAFVCQKRTGGSVWIYVFDAGSGKQVESINAETLDPAIPKALSVPPAPVSSDGLRIRPGFGAVTMMNEANGEGGFWLGVYLPTGGVREIDGERYHLAETTWLEFDIV